MYNKYITFSKIIGYLIFYLFLIIGISKITTSINTMILSNVIFLVTYILTSKKQLNFSLKINKTDFKGIQMPDSALGDHQVSEKSGETPSGPRR